MIAKMRHLVVIQQPSDTGDSRGGRSVSWSTLATVWAEIIPKTAKEVNSSEQIEHQIDHIIKMRYRSDVLATHRISYDSRFFYIRGIKNKDERSRWLILNCKEGDGIAA